MIDGEGGPEYTCPYDEFTAERNRLHEAIITTMLSSPRTSGVSAGGGEGGGDSGQGRDGDALREWLAASDEQHIFIVAGVPGSGKDSVLKRYLRTLGLPLLDASADLVKEYLAAYAKDELSVAVRAHNEQHGPGKHLLHAQYLHRESVHLIDVLMERAMEQKRCVVLEKTLFDSEHVMSYARRFAARGCRIHLLGTHITPLKNWEFLSARTVSGQSFGRYISKEQVVSSLRQYHANLQRILASDDDRATFDTIHVFDVVANDWSISWWPSDEQEGAAAGEDAEAAGE